MELNFVRARRGVGLLAALSPLALLGILWPSAGSAYANSVVVGSGNAASCNMTTLATAMNNNTTADITFNCGGPATITITQGGGLNVEPGKQFSIDGGNVITITGADSN